MEEKNARNWHMDAFADYETGPKVDAVEENADANVEDANTDVDISELTAKEIDDKVESGELTAEQVYAAEQAGKQRKGVLTKYAPADENDKGTTGEDA